MVRIWLSPVHPVALGAIVVVGLITMGRFRSSALQVKNGFVAWENCFIAVKVDETFPAGINNFNGLPDGSLTHR